MAGPWVKTFLFNPAAGLLYVIYFPAYVVGRMETLQSHHFSLLSILFFCPPSLLFPHQLSVLATLESLTQGVAVLE